MQPAEHERKVRGPFTGWGSVGSRRPIPRAPSTRRAEQLQSLPFALACVNTRRHATMISAQTVGESFRMAAPSRDVAGERDGRPRVGPFGLGQLNGPAHPRLAHDQPAALKGPQVAHHAVGRGDPEGGADFSDGGSVAAVENQVPNEPVDRGLCGRERPREKCRSHRNSPVASFDTPLARGGRRADNGDVQSWNRSIHF